MTKQNREAICIGLGVDLDSRLFRIKGSTEIVKASCISEAIYKLTCIDAEDKAKTTYTRHWYTRSLRKSWAEVATAYGTECIVEEI